MAWEGCRDPGRTGIFFALLLITALALSGPVGAATVTIDPGQSIQAAITAAGSDGTVILNPGVYYQSGISVGNSVTLKANTTYGHGSWDTIIDGEKSGEGILRDPSGYFLAIDNLTFQNGAFGNDGAIYAGSGSVEVTSSTFTGCSANNWGGAIYAGSVAVTSSTFTGCSALIGGGAIAAGSVTVTSSTFTGCLATYRGGAISANRVTVTSSTFTGCSASFNDGMSGIGDGGAISAEDSVTVTSSTFTGCSAHVSGGAISAGSSVTVTSSTFTGCSATLGGAIYTGSGSTINFCRFYHDTLGTTVYANSGTPDASDNWWGTSSGPSSSDIGGGATAPTWLVLGIAASPATITTGGTSTISANLTYHSNGAAVTAASGTVPDGTPVTFTATGGTVSPSSAITNAGIATTTFTPSGTGTATITATVDDQSVTVPVEVTTPAADTNVTSLEVDPAQPATVYAGIDGSGVYRSPDSGSSWTHLTLPTGADLRIRALAPVRLTGSPATTLYAGSYGGGVYRSTDGGANWDNCGILPNQNVLSLVANTTAGVYAGTESGVYASTDGCDTWTAVNNGLP